MRVAVPPLTPRIGRLDKQIRVTRRVTGILEPEKGRLKTSRTLCSLIENLREAGAHHGLKAVR